MNAMDLALSLGSYAEGRDFLLSCFYMEALGPHAESEQVYLLRCSSADQAARIVNSYQKSGFIPRILLMILLQKLEFLAKATTQSEAAEILKPSIPVYQGGRFHPAGPYHVLEEEILLWSYVSPSMKLSSEAATRAYSLFPNYQEEYLNGGTSE